MPRHRALLLTGSGAHTDRWHDLGATSVAVGRVLAERCEVTERSTDDLTGLADADLLVLNVAGDRESEPTDSRPVVDALLRAHAAGTGLLALHSSSIAFRDDPRWAELLGGRWVSGVSDHPPIGDTVVRVRADAPFGEPGDLALFDERYTALERRGGTLVVAEHDEAGASHPLVWARDPADGGRVVYSALGHDTRSYESPGHRQLLADAATWVLHRREGSYTGTYSA